MSPDPYRFGTRSDETRRLQAALAAHGFDPGPADGIFGRGTNAAVAAARMAFGLPAGGVDAALLARLGLASGMPAFAGQILQTLLKGLLPMTFLSGYRTYIVAAIMLLTGLAGLLGLDIPSFTGHAPGTLVMDALAFFFLRQGLKTDGTQVPVS